MFPLEIFPERSLAESVITTVWVGVFVVAYFNLRLGWPFSGLVVPGYLVPLLISKPASGIIVIVEGIISYFIVKYMCERFAKSGSWSSFFGRDRFFAMIIVSLLVRLVLDGWMLPMIGELVNQQLQIGFDYRNNLSSFGLIIVALIGNQFWKTGFVRGLTPFCVTLGLTFVLIRFVLMEYTNFNIGTLEYMYENISSSLVASPKAYIVLLTCAFVASRMNLLYGWDFNGILIPSLLALEWYHPATILVTFLEAYVILGCSVLLMRTPIFSSMTIEGARKLLLFFNVSYFYKFILGHIQQMIGSTDGLTDYYGFGYLVPTLIAIKMHDKHIPLRLARATLQTSFTGAVIAGFLGFLLTLIPQMGIVRALQSVDVVKVEEIPAAASLAESVRVDKLNLYQKRGDNKFVVPLASEIDSFVRSMRCIEMYRTTKDPVFLRDVRNELKQVGYEVLLVEDRYLYLREGKQVRGWGLYAFDLHSKSGPVVEIPLPLGEWAVLETGTFLFQLFKGQALAIGGCSRKLNRDGSADVLLSGRTIYSVFHRMMGRGNVIQVRGYTDETILALGPELDEALDPKFVHEIDAKVRSSLWAERRIPEGMDLLALREMIGEYDICWGKTPFANLQRDETRGAFCELVLSREDRKRLLSLSITKDQSTGLTGKLVRVNDYLPVWLLEKEKEISARGSNLYVPPKQEELLLFDEELLVPLFGVVQSAGENGLDEKHEEDLSVLAAYAGVFNYKLLLFDDKSSGSPYVILSEGSENARCWGTYVFRLSASRPFVIQVPRPLLERYVYEYGIFLFQHLKADVLMLAGAHPWTNENGMADVTRIKNRHSLFQLVHQACLRERKEGERLVVQLRAFGFRGGENTASEDVLLSLASGCGADVCFDSLTRELHSTLESDQVSVRVVNGDESTAGYEAFGSPQAHYSFLDPLQHFSILWLSPFFRESYRQETHDSLQGLQFASVGISSRDVNLFEYLNSQNLSGLTNTIGEDFALSIQSYVQAQDVVALRDLELSGNFERMERLIDESTRRAYLAVYVDRESYPVIFRLTPFGNDDVMRIESESLSASDIFDFQIMLASRLEVLKKP